MTMATLTILCRPCQPTISPSFHYYNTNNYNYANNNCEFHLSSSNSRHFLFYLPSTPPPNLTILSSLKCRLTSQSQCPGMKMKLPRHDKSAFSGRGDRADSSTWPEVEGPLTVVLFEGWMLGFKPLPVEAVKAVDPQAEIAMREAGKPAMSDEEFRDFVSRYLPAYNAYLPTLYGEGPNGSDPQRLLIIEIDEGRNPILAT